MILQFKKADTRIAKRAVVREHIMRFCSEVLAPGETASTTQMFAHLWPTAGEEDLSERMKAVDLALNMARTELFGKCCMQGPADPKRKFMGKPTRPWLWYHPEEKGAVSTLAPAKPLCCPSCGYNLSLMAATK